MSHHALEDRRVSWPYAATEMQGFAQVSADSIQARIQSGQNIYDQTAAPLKPGPAGPARGHTIRIEPGGIDRIASRISFSVCCPKTVAFSE
jgi:hypothetical protein